MEKVFDLSSPIALPISIFEILFSDITSQLLKMNMTIGRVFTFEPESWESFLGLVLVL
jgi:hypothetical protein